MKTKQSVKLIYSSPLWLISNAIHYSHNNHDKSDSRVLYRDNGNVETTLGSKDFNLIKKVGFHMLHFSVCEHSLIVFDIKLTQKALLEMTRSRIGVAYTVTSSRYALDSMGIEFEPTGKKKYDKVLNELNENIKYLLSEGNRRDFDNLAELLPQAFIYKMQVSFNLRSLVHFLSLRINPSAHIDIRIIAKRIIDELPSKYKELVLLDENIAKNYEKYKDL